MGCKNFEVRCHDVLQDGDFSKKIWNFCHWPSATLWATFQIWIFIFNFRVSFVKISKLLTAQINKRLLCFFPPQLISRSSNCRESMVNNAYSLHHQFLSCILISNGREVNWLILETGCQELVMIYSSRLMLRAAIETLLVGSVSSGAHMVNYWWCRSLGLKAPSAIRS